MITFSTATASILNLKFKIIKDDDFNQVLV
jgi:hypothetical protein